VLRSLAEQSQVRSLRARQKLWSQGAYAYELAFVWSGHLRVVRRQGEHVTFRRVGINELIGFSNAIGRAVCSVDVVAGESARVMLVPGDALRAAIPRCPEIAYRALEHLGTLVARLTDDIELLHTGRLGARLLRRLRTLGAGRQEIVITHQALAEEVAARRESVTRELKKLEARGALRCRRGRIVLVDLDAAS